MLWLLKQGSHTEVVRPSIWQIVWVSEAKAFSSSLTWISLADRGQGLGIVCINSAWY